jgi:hypothetical protein
MQPTNADFHAVPDLNSEEERTLWKSVCATRSIRDADDAVLAYRSRIEKARQRLEAALG